MNRFLWLEALSPKSILIEWFMCALDSLFCIQSLGLPKHELRTNERRGNSLYIICGRVNSFGLAFLFLRVWVCVRFVFWLDGRCQVQCETRTNCLKIGVLPTCELLECAALAVRNIVFALFFRFFFMIEKIVGIPMRMICQHRAPLCF